MIVINSKEKKVQVKNAAQFSSQLRTMADDVANMRDSSLSKAYVTALFEAERSLRTAIQALQRVNL